MKDIHIDLENQDLAEEMMKHIEKDYGRSIARIAYFKKAREPYTFDIKIIFTDFRLLEAKIQVTPYDYFELPSIQIQGIYH
jgi:hypothetical protein